jgi:hypothetical protein
MSPVTVVYRANFEALGRLPVALFECATARLLFAAR